MIPRNFPGKGKVALLKTSPQTVLADYARLMDLAGYQQALPKGHETILKINISWQTWYPACSSEPWQIEGVIKKLQADGYTDLSAAHNKTVVVDAYVGEKNNKQKDVVDAHGLRNVHLYEPEIRWVRYVPKAPMLVLDRIFPEGILLPEYFFDKNIIQLPTVKTHVFTVITGAMKNAFGGLLNEKRHWTHGVIHETVVDLLAIQQEIHSGLFAVMDGTFAGDGPGPARCAGTKRISCWRQPTRLRSMRSRHRSRASTRWISSSSGWGTSWGWVWGSEGDRDRRPRHLGRGLGIHPGRHLREQGTETDLSWCAEAFRESAAALTDRAVELLCLEFLP